MTEQNNDEILSVRKAVIQALESGNYNQGHGLYYHEPTNCYYAVGIMLAVGLQVRTGNIFENMANLRHNLGYRVDPWFDFHSKIISLNDSGHSFKDIAGMLREEWNISNE